MTALVAALVAAAAAHMQGHLAGQQVNVQVCWTVYPDKIPRTIAANKFHLVDTPK